jgi:hypothetical protein
MLMEYPDIKMRELDDQSAIEVARKTSGAQLFRAVFVDVGDGSTELQIIGSKETPAELVRAYVQDCTPA